MGDYNNAVNADTGSPEKNLLVQWPLQNKVLAKEFQERAWEEFIIQPSTKTQGLLLHDHPL